MRQRIRSVPEWAIAMELRNDNPCDRVLPVLGAQNDIVTHHRALPHQDVAAAVETVRTSESAQPAVKLAFENLVLTAARSGEVRLATWGRDRHGWRGVDGLGRAGEGEARAPGAAERAGVGDPLAHLARQAGHRQGRPAAQPHGATAEPARTHPSSPSRAGRSMSVAQFTARGSNGDAGRNGPEAVPRRHLVHTDSYATVCC